ncbi:SDR family oxidoreductase [Sphingosinicellaceae bacterium]|nr:SDR family oxidoreductase [Sphingosinicellaceae bacterium]
MSNRLAGRHAVITGAGSGIGQATAARLRADGAKVWTVDRAGDVDQVIDVTAPGASEAIIAAAKAGLGRVDTVMPFAGIVRPTPLDQLEDDNWDTTIAVNLTAVHRLVRAARTDLEAAGNGRVVLVSSVMGSFGSADLSAYAASKHGVIGLTRSLAASLGPFGCTVNAIQPGAIETPMTTALFAPGEPGGDYWRKKSALGHLGKPEDIADVAAFLVSDDARFVSGHGILVDGASTNTP